MENKTHAAYKSFAEIFRNARKLSTMNKADVGEERSLEIIKEAVRLFKKSPWNSKHDRAAENENSSSEVTGSPPNRTEDVVSFLNGMLKKADFEFHLCKYIEKLRIRRIDRYREELLIACAQVNSIIVKDSAVQLLGDSRCSGKMVEPVLASKLHDSSWIIRSSAMYALGARKACGYTKVIIERYKSWSFIEKKWVLMALVKMRDIAAKDFLLRIFKYSKNSDRKYLAAAGLSALGFAEPRLYLKTEFRLVTDPEARETLELCMELI